MSNTKCIPIVLEDTIQYLFSEEIAIDEGHPFNSKGINQ